MRCCRVERADHKMQWWRTLPGYNRLWFGAPTWQLRRYYETVWKTRKLADLVLIKTLLYAGVRVSELVAIWLDDVDFDRCQIRVNEGKGRKDRVVPFPSAFKETLALPADALRKKGGGHLFGSSRKKPYSDRDVRRLLELRR